MTYEHLLGKRIHLIMIPKHFHLHHGFGHQDRYTGTLLAIEEHALVLGEVLGRHNDAPIKVSRGSVAQVSVDNLQNAA